MSILEMFESEPNLKIISFASEGFEAVQKAKELQPDAILETKPLPNLGTATGSENPCELQAARC